jgi:adenylylsulfate kinase-like enzyme
MSTAPDLSARGRALSEKLSGVSVYLVGMMGSGKSTVHSSAGVGAARTAS